MSGADPEQSSWNAPVMRLCECLPPAEPYWVHWCINLLYYNKQRQNDCVSAPFHFLEASWWQGETRGCLFPVALRGSRAYCTVCFFFLIHSAACQMTLNPHLSCEAGGVSRDETKWLITPEFLWNSSLIPFQHRTHPACIILMNQDDIILHNKHSN